MSETFILTYFHTNDTYVLIAVLGLFSKVFLCMYVCMYVWLHWVFIAARGLSLAAASRGYSFVAVHRLLIVVASLVAEHGL